MDTIMVQHTGLDQRSFDEKYGRIPDDRPTAKEVFGKLRQACRCSGSCLSAFIRQHVPLVDLITTYKFKEYILGDIIAGISLAILQVPQGMGYALLATLPPIIGLYTSFFPVPGVLYLRPLPARLHRNHGPDQPHSGVVHE